MTSYTTVKAEIKTHYPGHEFEFGTWDDCPRNVVIVNVDSPDKSWDSVIAGDMMTTDVATLTERVVWVAFDTHEFVDMEALRDMSWRNHDIAEIAKCYPEDYLTLVLGYSFDTRAHWGGYDDVCTAVLVGVLDDNQPFPIVDLSKLPMRGKDYEVIE